MEALWRVGQQLRAIGPNPKAGGKRPAPEVEVTGVDTDARLYTVRPLNGTKLVGDTMTFEAGASMWLLTATPEPEALL